MPVEQPEDRGILLRDILETSTSKKGYALDPTHAEALNMNPSGHGMNGAVIHCDGKSRTLTTNKGEGPKIITPIRIGEIENAATGTGYDTSKQYKVYSPDAKATALCGNGGGLGAKTGLYATPVAAADGKRMPVYAVRDGFITIKGERYPIKLRDGFYIIRKLTVTECKRLQTVPDTYAFPVSDTQAYKMLGNGWTVGVIAHIMSHFDGLTTEPVEVLSMYDGMSCGHIALDKLGAEITAYYATEIDKYAIQTTQHNFPETIQLGDAFQVRNDDWRVKE